MATPSTFLASYTHRTALISSSPSPIRIKYLLANPPPSTSPKGTLLLIHGFPQTAYQFRHVILPLAAAGYTVVAPDYTGAGGSSKPTSLTAYRKSAMATHLHALVREHLQIQEAVHVVGHDIGGMVAHAYATLYPDDTRSVMWGECPLPGTRFFDDVKGDVMVFHFVFHKVLDLPEALIQGREEVYLKHFFDKLLFNVAAIGPADLDVYVKEYSQPGGVRAGVNVYRVFEEDRHENLERREREGRGRVRCCVLSGGESFLRVKAREMAEEFYEKEVVEVREVKGSGHYIAEENPQGFVEEVLRFVEMVESTGKERT